MLHAGLVFYIERTESPKANGRFIADIADKESATPKLVHARFEDGKWYPDNVTGWLHGFREGLLISDKAEGQDSFFQVEEWIMDRSLYPTTK